MNREKKSTFFLFCSVQIGLPNLRISVDLWERNAVLFVIVPHWFAVCDMGGDNVRTRAKRKKHKRCTACVTEGQVGYLKWMPWLFNAEVANKLVRVCVSPAPVWSRCNKSLRQIDSYIWSWNMGGLLLILWPLYINVTLRQSVSTWALLTYWAG